MSFICSVLKPFGDLSTPEKHQSFMMFNKKSKSYMPYFYENMHRYQSECVSIDSLLNRHLSILPFKPYFEPLYKLSEVFNRLDFILNHFDLLKPATISQQLMVVLTEAGCLNSNYAREFPNDFINDTLGKIYSDSNFAVDDQHFRWSFLEYYYRAG